MNARHVATFLLFALPIAQACDGGLNLFSVEDDIELGAQLKAEIDADPENYPVLDPVEFSDAYDHLDRVAFQILDEADVKYRDRFDWSFTIIDDGETLNAFAAPGGHIWVYSGLIAYLSHEDELAGVLGHEIGHSASRHATEQLTKVYGLSLLIEIVLGENTQAVQDIAGGLVGLSFSRENEREADDLSVRYLCETAYAADGAAGFFETLEGAEMPAFLSTHPSSESRVEEIRALAQELGCDTAYNPDAEWEAFLASLP